MAMSLRRLPCFKLLSCASALLSVVGCAQRTGPVEMVDRHPQPQVTQSPAWTPPKPGPVQTPPQVVKPQPKPPVAQVPVPSGVPRDWVPTVASRNWKWIVVHHSATPVGGAARFNKEHIAKGWDELGYHFVIGNGTDTGNGAIEVGSRWAKQKQGAHCKTADNKFNDFGIGICLVGNFDQTRPSEAQLRSLAKLIAYLQQTYHVSNKEIIGHGDAKATDCPGRNVQMAIIRRMSAAALADRGAVAPADVAPASVARTASAQAGGELMYEPVRK
ncbi:peptidoglycan recognition protein family protein [Humisphaera borealis]|uniref:N-acetylmuramoyl-L-alanine amidase n=1 Tax=Humisphaera borealis TaxID=2807512 RepID=A0A7M2X2B9_9BACT|nr:peptidoglycan recognition family protein [Humisphaera borealis]QOV91907.1 N-acetylmuramoyl-L-alanine amidase [Humisphaera borealis]